MICPKCGSKHTYPLSIPIDSGVVYSCEKCKDHWIEEFKVDVWAKGRNKR